MLYLEDYLEMIEHLPQELRDRFTEMREMDLQVQNAMDTLDEKVKHFFAAAKKMKPSDRDAEYKIIDEEYYKVLEDADEKIHISNQIFELVEKYIRRLDQEQLKFKMELEADNAGITQLLEERSKELDKPLPTSSSMTMNNIKSEKRKHSQLSSSLCYTPDKQLGTEKVLSSLASDAMRETITANRVALTGHSPSSSSTSSSCSTNSIPERSTVIPPSKGNPFGGGNALAAAASQAIAATQQSLKKSSSQSQSNMVQGRRTASLKASYEAINAGFPNLNKEFTIGAKEIAAMQSVSATTPPSIVISSEPKNKMKKARTSSFAADFSSLLDNSEDSSTVDDSNASMDWTYDPNEPRYCICNQVSYGDMVACDNLDCPHEWFHYPCVGIAQPPKGKWYCPLCTVSMKRRGRKDK